MELGVTLMRDVFSLAKKRRPCIMLLHNFDALSRTSKLTQYASTRVIKRTHHTLC
jgi:ATP-dependent 26S proteasome regulatory subunit